MNKILLDTNVLIWLLQGNKLSPSILKILSDTDKLMVSAISIFEIRIKQELSKLAVFELSDAMADAGILVIAVDEQQAKNYHLQDQKNRDPFDNFIISTALNHNLWLATSDSKILALDNKKLKTIDARK